MLKRRFINSTLYLVSAVLFIQAVAAQDAVYVPCQEMPQLLENFRADRSALWRFYQVEESPERQARWNKFYKDYKDSLTRINFEGLSQECKVDYLLLKNLLDEEKDELADDEKRRGQLGNWFSGMDSVYKWEKERRRGATPNARSMASVMATLSDYLGKKRDSLKSASGKGWTLYHFKTGEHIIEGWKTALESVYDFYNHYNPDFSWWVPEPYKQLNMAIDQYATAWQEKKKSAGLEQDASGISGTPIGKAAVERGLAHAYIPYSPDELNQLANQEFDWCRKEMLRASRDLGYGDDWHAALEHVKNLYVPAGEQPAAIFKLYNESVDFIKSKDLITLPPIAEETWGMYMMSPERQRVSPFFLGGRDIIISYPTESMSYEDRMMSMRGNNPHFSRATVHHELLAGHHLQYYMNQRYRSYRVFDNPFWTEGWSLYWELILWDMGFAQTAEDRIGMLFWRMHRCARIVFSLNYHLGKWTPQQCVDYLVEEVGHERANAEGEVRRSFEGDYGPLYQLAYLVGGLQFYTLKREFVDSGKMKIKDFHDRIIHLNAMPVEMIRAIFNNKQLPKNFKSEWKFYQFQRS